MPARLVPDARRPLGHSLRSALVAACALSLAAPLPAAAADKAYFSQASGVDETRIDLGIGKSYAVTLPQDAKEVFVADPTVANAVVRTARKAYLIGAGPGQTDVKFLDNEGREIASYEVSVSRDVGSIRSSIGRSIDGGNVRVEGVGDGVVVTGSVKSAQEAQTAIDIAAGYMADPKKVVNALKIEGQDQVLLKVKVVEMRRDVIKQLGINYSIDNVRLGDVAFNGVTSFPFPINNSAPSSIIRGAIPVGGGVLEPRLQAMERAGVVRTLAEPNLTAISGEGAKFLAGGEFPFPGPRRCGTDGLCERTIEFKDFGVGLNFTPIVLSGGRISLKISTEVSELDPNNGYNDGSIIIPGLQVRRADSTVEIPSGGSIVMAGLIQQQTKRAASGFPGLMKLPVLGALFRSNDYLKNETELAVFVTPYLAKPTAPAKFASPDDGFAEPTEASAQLLGRLNRLYGVAGKIDPNTVSHRRGGFIID